MRRLARLGLVAALLALPACGIGEPESPPDRPAASPSASAVSGDSATAAGVLDRARGSLGVPTVLATVLRGGQRASLASGGTSGPATSPHATLPIGSVTKVLTAVLVMDAVDRGQLDLNTTVEDVLPGTLADGAEITMRMLLSHTSGLFAVGDEGDLLSDVGRLTDPALRTEAERLAAAFLSGEPVSPSVRLLVALAETHDRYGPPGTKFHYSNLNYLLLGSVLETVTGSSVADLLQERMAVPLGLAHTGIPTAGDPVDVRGHVVGADGVLADPGTAHLLLRGNGASGAAVSTTAELLTALRALVTADLLPAPATAQMLAPAPQSGGVYGLGVATYRLRCGLFYGHGGGIAGVDVLALVSPDGRDGVVVAADARPADGSDQLLPVGEELLCTELGLG